MTVNQGPLPRVTQDETLRGLLDDMDLRTTRLERTFSGPYAASPVLYVGTLDELPEPEIGMLAIVAGVEYEVSGGIWVLA